MDPMQLLASLGITLADLAAARPFGPSLRSLGLKSGSLIQFAFNLRQEPIAGLEMSVRSAYNVANFLAFQGVYLEMLPATSALPFQLAEVVGRRPFERVGEANYRYDFELTVTFPSSGEVVPKYVSVDSPTPISAREAEALAWEQFIRDIGFDTLPGGGGDAEEYFDPRIQLAGFYRLT